MMTPMRTRARHTLSLFACAVLTVAWLWPIVESPANRIPGESAGDNLLFVWNLWWTRHALLSHVWPLWCPALFAPFGVDLTLNTHTLLPTVLIARVSRTGSVVTGTNAIVAMHLFLNFAIAYLLSFRLTRDATASFVGALFFGWSPYIALRLLGHFNLLAAWVLPLTALLAFDAVEQRSKASAILLGVTIGAIAYLDYYYLVYAVILVGVLFGTSVLNLSWGIGVAHRWQRVALLALATLVGASLVAALIIHGSGGMMMHVGAMTISMESAHNPVAAAGLLFTLAVIVAAVPASSIRVDRAALKRCAPAIGLVVAIAIALMLPLVISGARLWLRGDYVSQRYLWRSAPAGIDVGTMVLGNPTGAIWSHRPLGMYGRLGIDAVEQTGWFDPAMLVLAIVALRRGTATATRPWTVIALVFGTWALGPYLVAFGRTLPLVLPAILSRYFPLASNARMPGRALVLVYMAVAILAAFGFRMLRESGRSAWAFALAALALADLVPSWPPTIELDRPAIYQALRDRSENGAICELPLGLRDGFGEAGDFDSRTLFYQTIHERPITGGFVARMPPRLVDAYERDLVLGPLLRLSARGSSAAAEPAVSKDVARAVLDADGIRFVVIDIARAKPQLLAFVHASLPLRFVGADHGRELYLVER